MSDEYRQYSKNGKSLRNRSANENYINIIYNDSIIN